MSKYIIRNKSLEVPANARFTSTNPDSVVVDNPSFKMSYADKRLDLALSPAKHQLPLATQTIPRFDKKYWTVDGPNTASFSIRDLEDVDGFEVNFICRRSDDLIGVVWDSEDKYDHKYLQYGTNYDYSGLIWEFDIEMADTMPVLNSSTLAPTLTVKYKDAYGRAGVTYIALHNYADNPASRSAHITINWDEVRGGYAADTTFRVSEIESIFFGAYCNQYDKVNPKILTENVPGFLRVSNSKVHGNGATLPITRIVSGGHKVGMSTSYDDHYNLNPSRVASNLFYLGYRGMVNHYCGMSHYPEMHWDTAQNRFYIPDVLENPDAQVVNESCRLWHLAFARALRSYDMYPVYSVSWELYSQAAREEWCQRDYNDQLGRTGYEPPSYFASLCNNNAITYLYKAYHEFADTIASAGFTKIRMQIGEPWWWINTSTNKPCVYDYATRLAFNAETSLYAPDLGDIFEGLNKTDSTSEAFKTWLKHKLGKTCQNIRTYLKGIYGDNVEVCPLVFFPSILTPTPTLATEINYPSEEYSYPNFDFIMTEAYDWVISQPPRLDLSHNAVGTIPIDGLGYPAEKVAYLSGFVPDKMIAYIYKIDYTSDYRSQIWQRIFGDMANNQSRGILKQHVWAYPQVMQDSITIANDGFFFGDTYFPPIKDNRPYPDSMFGEDLKPYEPDNLPQPVNINVLRSSAGDLRIGWNTDNLIEGLTYEVWILSSDGYSNLLQETTSEQHLYVLKNKLTDIGFSGNTIKLQIVPSTGKPSDITDISIETRDDFIETVLFIAGDDQAEAHFTDLSLMSNINSSITIRDTYATTLGINPATVMVTSLGFGGSAVEKMAVDANGANADNYWYDASESKNGPVLTQALATMDSASSIPVRKLFWVNGSNDADAHDLGSPLYSTETTYEDATNAVLTQLLAKLSVGETAVWGLTNRKYKGTGGDAFELAGISRQQYRDAERLMISDNPLYRLGTWAVGAEKADGYVDESGYSSHYTPQIYHDIASDVGAALASPEIDHINDSPAWVDYQPITGIDATQSGEDIMFTWTTDSKFAYYDVFHFNIVTGELGAHHTVYTGEDYLTAAEQRAMYGFTASNILVKVVGATGQGIGSPIATFSKALA